MGALGIAKPKETTGAHPASAGNSLQLPPEVGPSTLGLPALGWFPVGQGSSLGVRESCMVLPLGLDSNLFPELNSPSTPRHPVVGLELCKPNL